MVRDLVYGATPREKNKRRDSKLMLNMTFPLHRRSPVGMPVPTLAPLSLGSPLSPKVTPFSILGCVVLYLLFQGSQPHPQDNLPTPGSPPEQCISSSLGVRALRKQPADLQGQGEGCPSPTDKSTAPTGKATTGRGDSSEKFCVAL